MKTGDMVQMVTGQPGYRSNPRNNGIIINIQRPSAFRRIAIVMSNTGELTSWPLDSHYEIKVVNESES